MGTLTTDQFGGVPCDLLILAVFFCWLTACSPSSNRVAETYTLPKAYVVSFHMIFSKNPKISSKEIINSRRYEVPDSGVL
ncbi:MAG: hypothetical protein ACI8O8_000712 [Oleiphilaceae bacterium]|jgi:hypothetical protein